VHPFARVSIGGEPRKGPREPHVNRPRRAQRVLLPFAGAGAMLAESAVLAAGAQDAWSPPPPLTVACAGSILMRPSELR